MVVECRSQLKFLAITLSVLLAATRYKMPLVPGMKSTSHSPLPLWFAHIFPEPSLQIKLNTTAVAYWNKSDQSSFSHSRAILVPVQRALLRSSSCRYQGKHISSHFEFETLVFIESRSQQLFRSLTFLPVNLQHGCDACELRQGADGGKGPPC